VPDTRELVLRVAREMGYVVNVSARSLITRRTSSVAVVSGDLRNPSFPVLIDTLQRRFHADGYRVVLVSDQEDASGGGFEDSVAGLRGGIVDGVVYTSARTSSPVVGDLLDAGMPVVVLNRDVDSDLGDRVDRITSDNVEGGRLAARHLAETGARRPAMVAGPRDNPSLARRERGFRAGLRACGLSLPRDRVRRGQVDPRTGLEAALDLFSAPAGERPDAVFCQTDYIALGVLDAAGRLGLSVPGDVAVIGYNDLDWAGWSMIDLTTVRQPLVQMAEAAAAAMLARIEDPALPFVHRVFDVDLVPRGSTRRPR
jgi:LacI family transcriptional regulator